MRFQRRDDLEELPLLIGQKELKLSSTLRRPSSTVVLFLAACALTLFYVVLISRAASKTKSLAQTRLPQELATIRPVNDKPKANAGPLLVTTAYWNIRSKQGDLKESDVVYKGCMKDVMTLNTPMVTYGDATALHAMQQARGSQEISLVDSVNMELRSLAPCSNYGDSLHDNEAFYTNGIDVPSVDLSCLWLAKFDLLVHSAKAHPNYDWFMWMDVCVGHGVVPFPHGKEVWPKADILQQLPKDKIIVSRSGRNDCEQCRYGWAYCHCLTGTSFVVPRKMVAEAASNFSKKVDECFKEVALQEDSRWWLTSLFQKNNSAFVCLNDQVILTKMWLDNPAIFFISSVGYGSVATRYLSGL